MVFSFFKCVSGLSGGRLFSLGLPMLMGVLVQITTGQQGFNKLYSLMIATTVANQQLGSYSFCTYYSWCLPQAVWSNHTQQ